MALYCTCGAELPDHARFCHACGKPQRSQDLEPEESSPPASAAPPRDQVRPPVNFGNPVALRVALLSGSLGALLNTIPIVSLGCCLWLIGAGFLSAYLYGRRMGLTLDVGEGARIGGMTGLLTFAITVVLASINFAILRGTGGSLREVFEKSMERVPAQDQVARQVMEFLSSPAGLAFFVVSYLILSFVMMIALSMAGGAMGAKVMEKD